MVSRRVPIAAAFARSNFGLDKRKSTCVLFVLRYSLEHKAQNHENILSVAARSFREHGGDSSGIGTVMKKVGLTKGGFYRHFKSKDDLFVEAVARAFDEMGRGMLEIAKSAPEGQALRAMIEYYLSPRHANSPGMGCVVSPSGQSSHESPSPCENGLRHREKRIVSGLRFVPGQTREEKVAKYQLLFPSMAGVLTAARMTLSPQKREQMLKEAKNLLSRSARELRYAARRFR